MKHIYYIKEQTDGKDILTWYTATTKREIESTFNRMMRHFGKQKDFMVQKIRMGYTKVTFFGTFGNLETEYWIERA